MTLLTEQTGNQTPLTPTFDKLKKYIFHSFILVFIHNPNDKMWAITGAPPIEMTSVQLGLSNSTEISVIEATLTEKGPFK